MARKRTKVSSLNYCLVHLLLLVFSAFVAIVVVNLLFP